jgi:hypothetical protein
MRMMRYLLFGLLAEDFREKRRAVGSDRETSSSLLTHARPGLGKACVPFPELLVEGTRTGKRFSPGGGNKVLFIERDEKGLPASKHIRLAQPFGDSSPGRNNAEKGRDGDAGLLP